MKSQGKQNCRKQICDHHVQRGQGADKQKRPARGICGPGIALYLGGVVGLHEPRYDRYILKHV